MFSSHGDESVEAVISHLAAGNVPCVLDLADFTHTFGASGILSQNIRESELCLPSGDVMKTTDVRSVWWWGPKPVRRRYELMPYHSDFVLREAEDFLAGLLSMLPADVRWYNHFESARRASNKIVQLHAATDSGLKIPETLITTDREKAFRFVERHRHAVLKPLQRSGAGWYPTRKLSAPEDPALVEALAVNPVYLQRYIEGPEDVRVIFMDDYLQAASFDLSTCRTPEDSRLDQQVSCASSIIPESLSRGINRCMRNLNLRYGAFDFRKDARGEYFFFEVNQAGYFLHLDQRAGTDIAKNIACILSRE